MLTQRSHISGKIEPIMLSSTLLLSKPSIDLSKKFDFKVASPQVVRPIQYLGSKVNVLDQITPVLKNLSCSDSAFFDLFAGTTVVAQSMRDHCTVISNDSMKYSKIFGDVFVVGPSNLYETMLDASGIIDSDPFIENSKYLCDVFKDFLDKENEALINLDEMLLAEVNREIPLFWKKGIPKSKRVSKLLSSISHDEANYSFPAFLLTTYYAGNYFGLRQAIELDSLVYAVHHLFAEKQITNWQKTAYISSVLSAASDIANTAGKHFAQYLQTGDSEKSYFANSRCIQDRSISVIDKFILWTKKISAYDFVNNNSNRSLNFQFEDIVENYILKGKSDQFVSKNIGDIRVGTLYADPPYTAQQYSRFYHVLETISLYDYPSIQLDQSGFSTKGIYRKERHYSPFCRKSKAMEYFMHLFKFAKDLNATLALSYSVSRAEGGNPRMVTPEELSGLAKDMSMKFLSYQVDHEYKPFNSSEKLLKHTAGREYLFIFES